MNDMPKVRLKGEGHFLKDSPIARRSSYAGNIRERIAALGLESNVVDLEVNGFTVIKNAAPLEFFGKLHAQTREVTAQRLNADADGDAIGHVSDLVWDLVGQGRVFEEAILNPKLNTLAEYLLGDGYVLNSSAIFVVNQGDKPLHIHTDYSLIPDPFPAAVQVVTSIFVVEDFTLETGATRFIPGSHRYARQPAPGEGEEEAVPVQCPAGSILLWNGSVWHGNTGRSAPGSRVTFHPSFCRMRVRPQGNNSGVDQAAIDRNPPLFAQLLGLGVPFGEQRRDETTREMFTEYNRLFQRRLS